jgi:hypothetical protein
MKMNIKNEKQNIRGYGHGHGHGQGREYGQGHGHGQGQGTDTWAWKLKKLCWDVLVILSSSCLLKINNNRSNLVFAMIITIIVFLQPITKRKVLFLSLQL